MSAERAKLPYWARREREADLDWIAENLDVFWMASSLASVEAGRGAIAVDTILQPAPGLGHPFGYFAQEQVKTAGNDDTKCVVKADDPTQEFVLVLLKPIGRFATEFALCRQICIDSEMTECLWLLRFPHSGFPGGFILKQLPFPGVTGGDTKCDQRTVSPL